MAKDKKYHRLVVEVDKQQFNRFRAFLLEKKGLTVSNWVRMEMDRLLNEPVKGRYKTKYLG
jgi:hypothetical protein